jgi:hypothetical protein
MGTWRPEEAKKLRELGLDPQRNPTEKLKALIKHFENNGSVWAVTEGEEKASVSKGLARKVRLLT